MASLTTIPLSPNSFQLRLRFQCKNHNNPSSLHFSSHLRKPFDHRRIRLRVSAETVVKDGNKEESGSSGSSSSWMGSDSSSGDSTSGWFGDDSNGGNPKRGFGGFVGAGLAGVVLASGVAFAALSLNKRNTSGAKQHIQMETMTAEEEILSASASDDPDNKIDHDSDKDISLRVDDKNLQTDSTTDNKTGITKVSSTSPEISEVNPDKEPNDNIDVGTSLTENIGYTSNSVDTISNAPSQEDLQVSSDSDDITIASDSKTNLPSISEMDILEGATDASGFKSSESHPSATIEPEENLATVDPDATVSDANSAILNSDHQEGNSISRPIEKLHMDFPSASGSDISSVPLEVHDASEDVMDTLPSLSIQENLSASESVQMGEGNSTIEVQNLNENLSPETTLNSALIDQLANELVTNSGLDKSSLFFDLPMSGSYSSAGIPAPSLVSAALQVPLGKVLVPAVVDQAQGQALAALQVLKVIEADVRSTDLCTRREYTRWLVSASSLLSRNSVSKVYPAMYIENVTELAFDDITPKDPDFSSIQGLAEAGLISSKLSRSDMLHSLDGDEGPLYFSPDSPLSRQDLVSWKMALEKRQLPEVDRKVMDKLCGFLDIDKIDPDAWPALAADLSAGEQGIISLAFGYTRLFQPDKPVTKAQAAIALATGDAADIVSEELARIEAESMAESAVAAHTALVAQVEKDVNANFEKELATEREKIDAIEKLAVEATLELERLRAEREEENNVLMRARAAVESEMEVLSRLRREVEEQLQSLMSDKTEISFEKERISKLHKEAESENQAIAQLQYELEVERKALAMARSWAEDEAKKAREHAKALEDARDQWRKSGLTIVVDKQLQEDEAAADTWISAAGKQDTTVETVNRAESLVEKLKGMADKIQGKSRAVIEQIIVRIKEFISALKEWFVKGGEKFESLTSESKKRTQQSLQKMQQELQGRASGFGLGIKEGATKVADGCREGVEKITQKFKT